MSFMEHCWYAWPWVGLGMGIIVIVLLFGTNVLRSNEDTRWLDPLWLAWLAMPAYLLHQFEEYALHITDGQYDIITQVFANTAGLLDLANLPMAHFPLVNIALVWAGVPLAAWLARKLDNPVVGLAPYGFILVNGFGHFAGTVIGGVPLEANPGFFTGALVFVPLSVLVIVACLRRGFTDGKGLAVALVSGVIAHALLGAGYAMAAIGGPVGVVILDIAAGLSPGLLAWIGCKALKVKTSLRQAEERQA